MKILRDMGTGIDGKTHDVIRWACGLGCLSAIGLSVYSVIYKTPFDVQPFCIGYGILLGAAGGALGMKAKTEPQGDTQ